MEWASVHCSTLGRVNVMYDQAGREAHLKKLGYDPRTTAWRPDVMAASLRGKLEAERYEGGVRVQCVAASSSMRFRPDLSSPVENQLLYGHVFRVYKEEDGFAWGQSELDDHVGFVRTRDLKAITRNATHWVCSPVASIFRRPNRQEEPHLRIPLNSRVAIQGTSHEDPIYARLVNGLYIFAGDIRKIGDWFDNPIRAILPFVDYSPYVSGYSDGAFDCSGITQAGWRTMNINCLRDADQQLDDPRTGYCIGFDLRLINLRPYDQVYWEGHTAFMRDEHSAIHATGGDIRRVVVEPIREIDAWRREKYGQSVSAVKRL